MNIKNQNYGFTLAELLIVVAIIAVLVAISIPVFNNQMEKAREAVDLGNIRFALEEVSKASLEPSSVKTTKDTYDPYTEVVRTDTGDYQMLVKVTQQQAKWQSYKDPTTNKDAETAEFAGNKVNVPNVGEGAHWVVMLSEDIAYIINAKDSSMSTE